jgi:hypothetical protein
LPSLYFLLLCFSYLHLLSFASPMSMPSHLHGLMLLNSCLWTKPNLSSHMKYIGTQMLLLNSKLFLVHVWYFDMLLCNLKWTKTTLGLKFWKVTCLWHLKGRSVIKFISCICLCLWETYLDRSTPNRSFNDESLNHLRCYFVMTFLWYMTKICCYGSSNFL